MSKETILVVDDEEDIREIVSFTLQKEGFKIITAKDGKEALKLVETEKPSLIVLDLMLPEIDGIDVCKKIRNNVAFKNIIILMLTAKDTIDDEVFGLNIGADDYMSKPFSTKILVSRVKTLLRRNLLENVEEIISFGSLKIDVKNVTVYLNKKMLKLTQAEFKILHLLVGHKERVFSREDIMKSISSCNYLVTERTIDVHIVSLRKKLVSMSANLKTIRGFGYKFTEGK